MRKRLYQILEVSENNDRISHIYDIFMIVTIIISLFPLAIKETVPFFTCLEIITTVIFIVDYIFRWTTADYKLEKGKLSFLFYPFTLMAIIDILSILPTFVVINSALKTLKVIRLIRALRVIKVFKSFRYSKNIIIISSVLKKQKKSLSTVCILAISYILISALVIFNVEPETFNTFFDAVYWATVSLTTVGYGDIYTISVAGKIITMISAILGIAIVALPAGIITAGYMNEIQNEDNKQE
ncbi:MAG: ion transporter [Clostridia bacterium]|nr:ion transporter [Clostridia bacterium]